MAESMTKEEEQQLAQQLFKNANDGRAGEQQANSQHSTTSSATTKPADEHCAVSYSSAKFGGQ